MGNETQTPSNNGEILVQRDERGRVKEGSVLNPAGKPKGTKHLSTLLIETLLEGSGRGPRTNQEIIVNKVIDMAKKGDMRAIALVWDRIEGKAPQSIKHTSDDEKPLFPDEESKARSKKALDDFFRQYKPIDG